MSGPVGHSGGVGAAGIGAAILGVVGLGLSLYEYISGSNQQKENRKERAASKKDKAKRNRSDRPAGVKKTASSSSNKARGSKYGASGSSNPPRDNGKESIRESALQLSESSSDSESIRESALQLSESSSDSESSFEIECSSEMEEVLKMGLINARSLHKFINQRNRRYSPATLMELLEEHDLDVLLITETWLKQNSLTDRAVRRLLPKGFDILHVPRPIGRGGGVAIVYRDDLRCEQILFQSPQTFEYIATAVTPPGSREPVLILNIYRPPGGSLTEFKKNFLREFQSLMSNINATYRNVVIGGDFNIWVDSTNKKALFFKKNTRENGLVQHVSHTTHSRGHILDLVLTRSNVRVTIVSIQENKFSDHSIVVFMVNLSMKKDRGEQKRFRKYR